jgi:hypothetical protein
MATGRAFQPADVPVDTHQDRAPDDHAESGRHGAVAAASADVTFCSTPACCLKIRIRRYGVIRRAGNRPCRAERDVLSHRKSRVRDQDRWRFLRFAG